MPADSPNVAVISGHGISIRLENRDSIAGAASLRLLCNYETLAQFPEREFTVPGGVRIEFTEWPEPLIIPSLEPEFIITRARDADTWVNGRAGMQYRDLIPGKLGGAVIASHIRIPDGGETPDYVHYHRVLFQMIYCKAGWARLVYEDQGPPFIMNAGDCVLQPPGIRHRVLETSPGFEVIEMGCPAVHETYRDHDMSLPTGDYLPRRIFGGQRFVHHIASEARWSSKKIEKLETLDLGISDSTNGLATVCVIKGSETTFSSKVGTGILFYFVLEGAAQFTVSGHGDHHLSVGDCVTLPTGADFSIVAGEGLEILEMSLHLDHY